MKKIYIAKCNSPLRCKETFDSVVQNFDKTTVVSSGIYLIHTEEELKKVRSKFKKSKQPCDVSLEMIVGGESTTNDFTLSIPPGNID